MKFCEEHAEEVGENYMLANQSKLAEEYGIVGYEDAYIGVLFLHGTSRTCESICRISIRVNCLLSGDVIREKREKTVGISKVCRS